MGVGQTWPYTYKGFKRPNLVLDAHLSKSRFGRRGEEKREKKVRVCKRSSFGVILSHFLLLRGQATWKGRFEGAKVRKSNPNLIFYDFDFWGKALT